MNSLTSSPDQTSPVFEDTSYLAGILSVVSVLMIIEADLFPSLFWWNGLGINLGPEPLCPPFVRYAVSSTYGHLYLLFISLFMIWFYRIRKNLETAGASFETTPVSAAWQMALPVVQLFRIQPLMEETGYALAAGRSEEKENFPVSKLVNLWTSLVLLVCIFELVFFAAIVMSSMHVPGAVQLSGWVIAIECVAFYIIGIINLLLVRKMDQLMRFRQYASGAVLRSKQNGSVCSTLMVNWIPVLFLSFVALGILDAGAISTVGDRYYEMTRVNPCLSLSARLRSSDCRQVALRLAINSLLLKREYRDRFGLLNWTEYDEKILHSLDSQYEAEALRSLVGFYDHRSDSQKANEFRLRLSKIQGAGPAPAP